MKGFREVAETAETKEISPSFREKVDMLVNEYTSKEEKRIKCASELSGLIMEEEGPNVEWCYKRMEESLYPDLDEAVSEFSENDSTEKLAEAIMLITAHVASQGQLVRFCQFISRLLFGNKMNTEEIVDLSMNIPGLIRIRARETLESMSNDSIRSDYRGLRREIKEHTIFKGIELMGLIQLVLDAKLEK